MPHQVTKKIFSREAALTRLKELQEAIRNLEDQHRYAEAEELGAVEMIQIMNIEAIWPGAFDNA